MEQYSLSLVLFVMSEANSRGALLPRHRRQHLKALPPRSLLQTGAGMPIKGWASDPCRPKWHTEFGRELSRSLLLLLRIPSDLVINVDGHDSYAGSRANPAQKCRQGKGVWTAGETEDEGRIWR